MNRLLPIACIALGVVACDNAPPADDTHDNAGPVDVEKDSGGKELGKADHWGSADEPTIFSADIEKKLANLPLEGAAANTPWAGYYWATYEDNINNRWAGPSSKSPAQKYGEAFGVANVEEQVSKNHGIAAYTTRTACTTDAQCDSKIGEKCAKRTGQSNGFCIPTWWGICHAWAPASILEPEPVHPVTKNGVTFQPNDIKALISLTYNRSTSRFVSLRCNEDDASGDIDYDGYGIPTGDDIECKDTNAGTFHLLLANYLGIRAQSFVEDRVFDDEVWNHPISEYRITQQKEVTAQEANKLVGVTAAPGSINNQTYAVSQLAQGTWNHHAPFTVIAGTTVKVETSSAKDVDLYVRVGSQPTESAYDCRPYDGTGNEVCDVTIPSGQTKLYVSVHGYEGPADVNVKLAIPTTNSGVPTTYLFNNQAAKLYHVKLEVDYIVESPASVDGNLSGRIRDFTRTDRYEYVLEVDSTGSVHGGEWIGASKRNHPDFLWLPTGRSSASIAGGAITYDKVKALLNESVGGSTNNGGSRVVKEENFSVAQGAWKHFGPYSDVAGGFSAVISGSGDADIYVRKGSQPTESAYDCRPYTGSSDETCTASGAGPFYVSVHGYSASTIKLVVSYDTAGGTTPTPTPTAHLNQSGNVAQGAMLSYSIPVVAGRKIVVRTTAPNDIDLYVRMNLAPTINTYDQRGYTASGNEALTVVPTANGILHIGVHGYAASSFTLRTADN